MDQASFRKTTRSPASKTVGENHSQKEKTILPPATHTVQTRIANGIINRNASLSILQHVKERLPLSTRVLSSSTAAKAKIRPAQGFVKPIAAARYVEYIYYAMK